MQIRAVVTIKRGIRGIKMSVRIVVVYITVY